MPSIVPGFEYDIFVSYRHNDNLDGWVTDFVQNLEKELRGTLKDTVTIYFDKNPRDGLLETYQVDKSLEGKLNTLIFIPIISQTYCDPKSFAWQHEFCVFNKLTRGDQFGRDIKLINGNVTSRILPVKIHDLDGEDKAAIEAEISGVLRAIEFIFKSPGVNRPLNAQEEHPHDNANKTYYRDQINKVANSIKELVLALKSSPSSKPEQKFTPIPATRQSRKVSLVSASTVILILIAGYALYRLQQERPPGKPDSKNSIAVLPFTNLSNDPEQEYFSDGITEQIITNLAHINSLKVIARTSVMKFKKTEKTIAEIGKELNVTHVLEGSIRRSNERVRVTAQLISVNDESHVWAQDYDRKLEDIFTVQDEVSVGIASQLERKLTPRDYLDLKSERPASVEAYSHYLKGFTLHNDVYYVKRLKEDFALSEAELRKAIELDPNYGVAFAALADLYDTYQNFGAQSPSEKKRYQALRDSVSNIGLKLSPNVAYVLSVRAYTFSSKADVTDQDVDSTFKYLSAALSISPNSLSACDHLSQLYLRLGLFPQAIQFRERAISLDPTFGVYYGNLAAIYLNMGDLKKSEQALSKALLMEPEGVFALATRARLRTFSGNLTGAEEDIQRMRSINPLATYRGTERLFAAMKAVADGEKEKAIVQSNHWLVYIALGMKKEAIEALDKDGSATYLTLKNAPFFASLRSEQQFENILEEKRLVYEERLKKYAN